jgi:deoxyhypusine synthase
MFCATGNLRREPRCEPDGRIVYDAKSTNTSVFILGGGSPKNFMLQTEPQIQEVMGIAEKGHDYFLQCTDARPDTGGLSGLPGEAGEARSIPKVCQTALLLPRPTISLPLICLRAWSRAAQKAEAACDRREEISKIRQEYMRRGTIEKIAHRTDVKKKPRRNLAKRSSSVGLK